MFDEYEKNPVVYAVLGFGIFSYMSADKANEKMEADWREKEISEQIIILPGQKANGFIYFRLPEGKTTEGCKLRLEIEKLEAEKRVPIELML
jgi:hypothetical protein